MSEEDFQVFQRFFCQHLAYLLQVLNLSYRQAVSMDIAGLEVCVPVDLGNKSLQVSDAHLVVVGLRVAKLHVVLGCFGQTGLQTQHSCSLGFGVVIAEQTEHVRYVLHIRVTNVHGCFILVDVILFLSQSKTALEFLEDVHRTVHLICVHIHTEDTELVGAAHELVELAAVLYGPYFLEFGLDSGNTFVVAARGIHRHIVEIAYLLFYSAGFVLSGGNLTD